MRKVIEWCSHCEQEVKINAIKCTLQHCPVCGSPIRACSLCNQDNCDCARCEKEE